MGEARNNIFAERLAALREQLGQAGMIRILSQFDNGKGNYASERRAWTEQTTLEEIRGLSGEGDR